MADGRSDGQDELAAGDFSSWMSEIQGAIRGERGSDVPCAGCTACCTSRQFIHIAPDETDTLSHIPADLLFPAPRRPGGHFLLGYDERGHCPMLINNKCSIYEHRPRTCRTYDCRIFPAARLEVDDDKILIARQARRWRFSFPTSTDRTEQQAVEAAAAFLDQHRDFLRDAAVPADVTRLAVLAIEIHGLFLGHDEETNQPTLVDPDPDVVRVGLIRRAGGAAERL
jgi:Fe-S-cluster containining protein